MQTRTYIGSDRRVHRTTALDSGFELADVYQGDSGWYILNSSKPGFDELEKAEGSRLLEWLRFFLAAKRYEQVAEIQDYMFGAIVPQKTEVAA